MTPCPCFKFCAGPPGLSVTCQSTELRRDPKGRIVSLHCTVEHEHQVHATIYNGQLICWYSPESIETSKLS